MYPRNGDSYTENQMTLMKEIKDTIMSHVYEIKIVKVNTPSKSVWKRLAIQENI